MRGIQYQTNLQEITKTNILATNRAKLCKIIGKNQNALKNFRTVSVCSTQQLQDAALERSAWLGLPESERETQPEVFEGFVDWNGFKIRYLRSGNQGPPVVLIHGFGGNCDHWRQNVPYLGRTCRVVALDLLGYGYSSKPNPREYPANTLYCFDTWSNQILDLSARFFGPHSRPLLISNSIGGIAVLEGAIKAPDRIAAVQVQNISLRKLHVENQPKIARPAIRAFQNVLRNTSVGATFFNAIANPNSVRNVLRQAYCQEETVTDELVDAILQPGLEPGAVEVFLDFISYSGGPLPAQQLSEVQVPVSILWGKEDPWERLEWGRDLANEQSVVDFVELEGLGHCPHDEGPEVVNPMMAAFVKRYSKQ